MSKKQIWLTEDESETLRMIFDYVEKRIEYRKQINADETDCLAFRVCLAKVKRLKDKFFPLLAVPSQNDATP